MSPCYFIAVIDAKPNTILIYTPKTVLAVCSLFATYTAANYTPNSIIWKLQSTSGFSTMAVDGRVCDHQ